MVRRKRHGEREFARGEEQTDVERGCVTKLKKMLILRSPSGFEKMMLCCSFFNRKVK